MYHLLPQALPQRSEGRPCSWKPRQNIEHLSLSPWFSSAASFSRGSTSSLVSLVLHVEITCLHIPKAHQFQLQLNFSWSFPNSVPTCPDNISVFLFGCLSLLLPPYCSFLHLKSVRSSLFSHSGPCYTCSASWTSGWTVLLLWGGVLEDQATFMGPSALKGRIPGDSAYQFREQAKVHMLEILSDYFITCFSHFPQVLNQPSLMTLQPGIPKTVLPHSRAAGPAAISQLHPASAIKCCASCIPYISQIAYPHHTAPSSRRGEFHVLLKGFIAFGQKNKPASW